MNSMYQTPLETRGQFEEAIRLIRRCGWKNRWFEGNITVGIEDQADRSSLRQSGRWQGRLSLAQAALGMPDATPTANLAKLLEAQGTYHHSLVRVQIDPASDRRRWRGGHR
jgi:hypothetical protein